MPHDMATKLIVNADDFGLTSAVNEEIIRCIDNGIVTSTSVIACGRAADEAIRLARGFKKETGLGVHLTLDSETPVSDPVSIPTIVSKRGILLSRSQLMFRLCKGQLKADDIRREWSAQIEKVIAAGLHPDHIDGHGHMHVFPTLVSLVIDIAKKFGICGIRLPRVPWSFRRMGGLVSLNLAAKYASRKFRPSLRHPDGLLGFSSGGCYSEIAFLKDIGCVKNGNTVEAMFHPGPDRIDIPAYNSWGYRWSVDSATLRSSRIKNVLVEKDVKLITFEGLSLNQ